MIAGAADIYGTVEWLDQVRIALIFGWLILATWLVVDNGKWIFDHLFFRKKPVTKYELCKLHSRPIGSCPPGSHGGDDEADVG